MPFGFLEKERLQRFKNFVCRGMYRFVVLVTRPFIDFYYNYGLSRASVMSYVLCANLIIFLYLLLAITFSVETFSNRRSLSRFLELHVLWPCPEQLLIEEAPSGFEISSQELVSDSRYEEALAHYCETYKFPRETVEKEHLKVRKFSITNELGNNIHEAIQTFQQRRYLTMSFFVILAIAYIVLLLSIKTNLAESVSPLIWGNLPLANRTSEIMKILWMIPPLTTIKKGLILFFMLPFLVAVAILLLFWCHHLVDTRVADPYTLPNNTFTIIISFVITGLLFTGLYKLHVAEISKGYASIGAFVASALWLGGRWFFTTYGAVSLYLNLRNFAFVPIALTWFYYLCAVFLFGIYVAHTLETPHLSSMARCWEMRDITIHSHYTTLAQWVRLDFLYRLAQNRKDEYSPPFIGIGVKGDTAEEIARNSHLSPPFVRECILEMLSRHANVFRVDVDGNRQYCRLSLPPEEVDVIPLISDYREIPHLLKEMEGYDFGSFLTSKYGPFWQIQPLMLSEVYNAYKSFEQKQTPHPSEWKKQSETEEIYL